MTKILENVKQIKWHVSLLASQLLNPNSQKTKKILKKINYLILNPFPQIRPKKIIIKIKENKICFHRSSSLSYNATENYIYIRFSFEYSDLLKPMDPKIKRFFDSVGSFFSGGDQIPWCDPDIILVCILSSPFSDSRIPISLIL